MPSILSTNSRPAQFESLAQKLLNTRQQVAERPFIEKISGCFAFSKFLKASSALQTVWTQILTQW